MLRRVITSNPALAMAALAATVSGSGCLQVAIGTSDPPAPTTSGGQAGGPHIDCVPRSIAFAPVAANRQDGATITCTNTGSATGSKNLLITIGSTGSPVFSAQFGSYTSVGLVPGQKGTINVTYSPVTVSDDQGSLILTTNAGAVTIPLIGYGLSPGCQVVIPTTNLDFGSTSVGTTKGPSTFTIDNASGTDCQIEAPIAVVDDPSGSFKVVSTNLQPNGSQYSLSPVGGGASELVVQVSFTPKSKGNFTANIGDFIAVSGVGQ